MVTGFGNSHCPYHEFSLKEYTYPTTFLENFVLINALISKIVLLTKPHCTGAPFERNSEQIEHNRNSAINSDRKSQVLFVSVVANSRN